MRVFSTIPSTPTNTPSHTHTHTKIPTQEVTLPFIKSDTAGMFDVWCTVEGGGNSGQAGAIRHGISRCIEKYHPHLRIALKRGKREREK
jgi:ribosomal protein S9